MCAVHTIAGVETAGQLHSRDLQKKNTKRGDKYVNNGLITIRDVLVTCRRFLCATLLQFQALVCSL